MATSYTSLLGFALPVQGELSGTWGDVVNDSITQLVEDSVAGVATASVASGNWTLTTTGSGAANEARCAILIPTGSPGVSRNIVAPSQSKAYIVINQSDAAVVVKGAATTGATIAAGGNAIVAWNGSDFVKVTATGDLVGPASATDNAVARFDGTTGKLVQNSSGVTISDANVVTASGFSGPLDGIVGGNTPAAVTGTTITANTSFATTNFTISESGGKLLFKYGATTIASLSSSGVLTTLSDVTSNGTP